jgi:hypothetical protein
MHFLKSILLILHTKMMLEDLIISIMFGWVVFSLTRLKKKITGLLNELEMRPETNPLISSIPEPPTDLVYGDENPLPDCRRRIPKRTSLPPNEKGSSDISTLQKEIYRLTEENSQLKTSLELATDERAREREEFEDILTDKQRAIDQKEKSLVQQDQLVCELTAEMNELKTNLAETKKTLRETTERNPYLDLSVQLLKEEVTALEAKLEEKQRRIETYEEFLSPRFVQSADQSEIDHQKIAQSQAEKRKSPKHVIWLLDDALALLNEAYDLTIEDEEILKRKIGAKTDTGQGKKGNTIKNWFVKKKEKPLSVLGKMMMEKLESLKELEKKMKVRSKQLIRIA